MQQRIAEMAAEEGIEFNWQQANSGNTFNAHRIIHLAQSKGLGHQAQEAFFYSYMTQGLPIGERETVEDVAARIGLDAAEVEYVLDTDLFADFVRHDEQIAKEQLKVNGVPFFVFDQRVALSGAQPLEVFTEVLSKVQHDLEHAEVSTEVAAQCETDNCELPEK